MRFRKIDQRHYKRVVYTRGSNQYRKRRKSATKGVVVLFVLLTLLGYVGVSRLSQAFASPVISPLPVETTASQSAQVSTMQADEKTEEFMAMQQEINEKVVEWMGLQELQIDRIDRKLEELEK